jgi:hypothetical protein
VNFIDEQEQTTLEQWRAVVAANTKAPVETGVRRREARRDLTLTSGRLTYRKKGKATPVERPCTLLDVSTGGLMVRARSSIAPNTPVEAEVFWGDETSVLRGTVGHCTPTVGAFKIGIKLHFAHTDPEESHGEANTMEQDHEVEHPDSEVDDMQAETSTEAHQQEDEKKTGSRISASHAVIGCLILLATVAFIVLSDGNPLAASARPSEPEMVPVTDDGLQFYHCGQAWNQAAYAEKIAFCERLAESLPNFGHDAQYYCRFLNKVFQTTDERVLNCTLSEAILVGLPSD